MRKKNTKYPKGDNVIEISNAETGQRELGFAKTIALVKSDFEKKHDDLAHSFQSKVLDSNLQIDVATSQIEAIESDLDTAKQDIASNTQLVASNQATIQVLQSQMQDAQTNIQSNTQDIQSLQSSKQNAIEFVELTDESGTLTDEQYEILCASPANIIKYADKEFKRVFYEPQSQALIYVCPFGTITALFTISQKQYTYSSALFQPRLMFDLEPTSGSQNMLKSGAIYSALAKKQDTLVAGTNIQIDGKTISATGTTYTAGTNIDISPDNVISANFDTSTLQPKLTAGDNILIDDSTGTISATNTTYTAGENVLISDENVISASFDTSNLQPKLTAGTNITIDQNNVISSTASGGGDTTALQTQIDSLQQQINNLKTPADDSYVGKSWSDFPAGTIVQTYDCLDLPLTHNCTYDLSLPKAYFLAEAGSLGTIKINIDYANQAESSVDAMFSVFLNDTIIHQPTITLAGDTQTHSICFELFDQNLNPDAKSNCIYVKIGLADSSHSINFDRIKTELIAPNAELINKYSPFDVEIFTDTYCIADCTGKEAKVCQISNQEIVNANTLQFEDLSITTPKLMVAKNFKQYGTDYVYDDTVYVYQQGNNKLMAFSKANNSAYTMNQNTKHFDFLPFRATSINVPCQTTNGKFQNYIYTPSNNNCGYSTLTAAPADSIQVFSAKYTQDLANINDSYKHVGYNDATGKFTLTNYTSSKTPSFTIEHCCSPRIYITNFVTYYNYTMEIYYKQFNKILKCTVSRTSNGFEQQGSTIEMGTYDDFFLGNNNDYFVVKGKKLEYHKFEQ